MGSQRKSFNEISDGTSPRYDEKKHFTVIESEMNRSTARVFTNPNILLLAPGLQRFSSFKQVRSSMDQKKPPKGFNIPMEAYCGHFRTSFIMASAVHVHRFNYEKDLIFS